MGRRVPWPYGFLHRVENFFRFSKQTILTMCLLVTRCSFSKRLAVPVGLPTCFYRLKKGGHCSISVVISKTFCQTLLKLKWQMTFISKVRY